MTTEFSDPVISDRLQAYTRAIDAANPTHGKLRIYSGTRPSPKGAAITSQVLLAEFVWPLPSMASVSGNVLTLALPPDVLCLADGTATWARTLDGANTFVADHDVGSVGSGKDIELSTVLLYTGGTCSIISATLTET